MKNAYFSAINPSYRNSVLPLQKRKKSLALKSLNSKLEINIYLSLDVPVPPPLYSMYYLLCTNYS